MTCSLVVAACGVPSNQDGAKKNKHVSSNIACAKLHVLMVTRPLQHAKPVCAAVPPGPGRALRRRVTFDPRYAR
eukprot:357480-Chlamydomonas_euryale.AAC.4